MKDFNLKSKLSYDKIADNYDNTYDGKFTEKFKDLLLDNINIPGNGNVLDVACGNGSLLKRMSKQNNINGFGIDISGEMIKNAQLNCPEMTFQNAGCEKIPFRNSMFDVITVCAAYHHFPDVKLFIREAERVLKRRGHIYIAEIYLSPVLRIICNPFIPLSKAGDVKFYSSKEIIKSFEKFSFKCVNVIKNGHIQIVLLEKR